jgi:hypothetical protein
MILFLVCILRSKNHYKVLKIRTFSMFFLLMCEANLTKNLKMQKNIRIIREFL